ncbi:MAG: ATP-binding protein [Verrucomicrobiota bacterium]
MVTLEASKPFRNLNPAERSALRQIAQERSFPAGQVIFQEGEGGDGVYVVKSGRVELSVKLSEQGSRKFAEVAAGDMFGEMAVLELKPRTATATAAEDSIVYFIPRNELLVMIERSPALSLELLREISHRLREFNQRYIQEILQTERLAIIGRFARSIVHDLKNPLNIIGLTTEVICMDKSTLPVRQQGMSTIRKQIDRVSDMIGEILDFTQGSNAQVILALMEYGAFVDPLLQEIRSETEIRGVAIETAPPPPVRVRLDPKRLRRVFYNLIHNATDAMPGGGRIQIRYLVDQNQLVTEIQDTGRGIAPEIAPKLFEAFASFGKAHGTGLGLSICKKIVEDHQGRIWARNAPDHGAIFSFTLPIAL